MYRRIFVPKKSKPVKNSKEVKGFKRYFNLVLFFLALMAIPFILLAMWEIIDLRSKAAPGTANLYIFPTNTTARTGESKTVQVWLDPGGTAVNSVQLIMKYDPTKINVTNITPGVFFTGPNVGTPLEILKDLSVPGTISYAASFPLGQNVYSSTAVAPVAEITYTGVADGTTALSFETTAVVATKVNAATGENALQSATGGQITISTVGYLSFGPIQPSNPQQLNGQFQADLLLDTGNQSVSAVDAKMTFDPSKFRVLSIVQSSTSPFTSYPEKIFDNTNGTISISANLGSSSTAAPVNGRVIKLATITFTAGSQPSISAVNFSFTPGDRNDSNIVLYNSTQGQEAQDILGAVEPLSVVVGTNPTTTVAPTTAPTTVPTTAPTIVPTTQPTAAPTATRTPTPVPTAVPTTVPTSVPTIAPTNQPTAAPTATRTPTPVPTAVPTTVPTSRPTAVPTLVPTQSPVAVIINIATQGRRRSGATLPAYFKVTLKTTTGVLAGTFTSGANTTTQTISVQPGSYNLLVEAPGYLSKRFGTTTTPIVISTGNQTLDLAQYPLLGGDLNSDGIINEVDFTLQFLTKFSTTDNIVDLDGSGKVNNLDYDIMRSNWGLVSDTL